jgi:type II secretory pathway component PulL
MESKHSEGQWTLERSKKGYYMHVNADGWNKLAKVVVRMEDKDDDNEEGAANAKLIVAAPDLLKTLVSIESITDRCNHAMLPDHIQELLRSLNNMSKDAIQKATF